VPAEIIYFEKKDSKSFERLEEYASFHEEYKKHEKEEQLLIRQIARSNNIKSE
jgi:hypothetical protein